MPSEKDNIEKSNQDRAATEAAERRAAEAKLKEVETVDLSDSEDNFPESRWQGQEYYRYCLDSGCEPEQGSGALRPHEYPEVKITPEGDVFGSYKDVKGFLQEEQLSGSRADQMGHMEAHHLLKDQYMQPFGIERNEAPSVAIYGHEHMQSAHGTNGIDFQLPRDKVYDIEAVVDGHVQAYNDIGRPEWGEQVKGYARENKERILTAYRDGTVPWATSEDTRKAERYLNSL